MSTYILSQLRGRPRRTLGVLAAVALATALFVALSALGEGYRRAARLPLAAVAADLVVTRPAPDEGPATAQRTRGVRLPFGLLPLTSEEVAAAVRTEGVVAGAAALQVWDFGPQSYRTLLGIDPDQTAVGPAHALVDGVIKGRAFGPGERGVVLVDRHYATFFRLKVGDKVMIGGQPFSVLGVAEQKGVSQAATANFYMPLADAQALAGLAPDQVNQIYLQVASAGDVSDVAARLQRQLGHLSAMSEDSIVQVMGGVGRISARFAGAAAAMGLLGGLLLAWGALGGLVAERRAEIGLMKAVGWRSREVVRTFVLESLLLCLAGAAVGVGLGWGSAWLLGRLPLPEGLAALNGDLGGLGMAASAGGRGTLPVKVSLLAVVEAVLIGVVGGTAAGFAGSRKAAAVKPAQGLRER